MNPWLPQGTVYGTLMNFASEHTALAAQMSAPPYKAAPQAPVLYIKTANTFSPHGSAIALPAAASQVQVRACVGLIFKEKQGFDHTGISQAAIKSVAPWALDWALFSDLTLPHDSFYRPPIKFNCLDGFLCAGPTRQALDSWAALDALQVTVRINGQVVHSYSTADMQRSAAQLVADVAEFIDLQPGDVLLLGSPFGAPLAGVGDAIEVSTHYCAPLHHTLLASQEART